jgi:hypothetical protein
MALPPGNWMLGSSTKSPIIMRMPSSALTWAWSRRDGRVWNPARSPLASRAPMGRGSADDMPIQSNAKITRLWRLAKPPRSSMEA